MSTYVIPCYLEETKRLERFLEEKARKGKRLVRIKPFWHEAEFEDVLEGDYHFCVSVYSGELSREKEPPEEFLQWKSRWEEKGWTFCCFSGNLVFFYSREKERPEEIQISQEEKYRRLGEITFPYTGRWLIKKTVSLLAVFAALLGFFLLVKSGERGFYRTPFDGAFWFLVWFLLSSGVLYIPAELLQRRRLAGMIKRRDISRRGFFWNRTNMGMLGFYVTTMAFFFWSVCQKSEKGVLGAAAGILAGAVYMGYHVWCYRKEKEVHTVIDIAGAIFFMAVFLTVSMVMPYPVGRRFCYGDGKGSEAEKQYARSVEELALKPEEIGWGTESLFLTCHTNENWMTKRELIISRDCWPQDEEFEVNSFRDLPYLNTMTVELKKEEDWKDYLKWRNIRIGESGAASIHSQFESYLDEEKKVLVNRFENRLVLYFLEKRDKRSFDLSDEKFISGVENNLGLWYDKLANGKA